MLIVICINLRLISFYDNMSTTKIRRKQTILLNIHTIRAKILEGGIKKKIRELILKIKQRRLKAMTLQDALEKSPV